MHLSRFSLPKSNLIRKPGEYSRVYKYGKRHHGSHFTLITAPNDSMKNRLGISIHGIKGAVRRNRIKRIIREFFRLNKDIIIQCGGSPASQSSSEIYAGNEQNAKCIGREPFPGIDMVFAIRKGFSMDSPEEVKNAVQSIFYRGKSGLEHTVFTKETTSTQ